MRHCESCGSELPDWARFCGSCGHPLPALAARAATELFRKAKDMIAWIILAYKRVVRRNNLSSLLRNSISTVGTGPLPALAARSATELFRKAKDMIAWTILAYKRVVRRNNLSSSLRNSIMLGSSLAILFPQVKHRGRRYFLWLHALVHHFIHAIGNVAIMLGSSLAISFPQVKHRGRRYFLWLHALVHHFIHAIGNVAIMVLCRLRKWAFSSIGAISARMSRFATVAHRARGRSAIATNRLLSSSTIRPYLSLVASIAQKAHPLKTRTQRSSNPPTSKENAQEEEHSNVLVDIAVSPMPAKGVPMVQGTPSASHPSTTVFHPQTQQSPHMPPHTQLPTLSLTGAVGVFLVALAYNAGRAAAPWTDTLFWFGLLVLFLPIAGRLFSPAPARRERIALIIVLGIALNLAKFLQYPLYFASYDEFAHWRTAQDIAASGHLFQGNPLLPISPLYPGLEIVTNALSSLTGLSIFSSGTVVIGVARLVLVLALYLFYEYISNSAHVAGIAALLYMANPGFLGTDVMFAYESLALPLAVFVVFVVARRYYAPAGRHMGLTLAIWLGLAAVVITHPLTSYAFVAFLCLWTVAYFQQGRGQKGKTGPGGVALLGLILSIAWLIYTGNIVVSYLTSPFAGAVHQLVQILDGERKIRPLFQDGSGFVTPLWEPVTAYTSVALVLLGIPFGLFRIWQHHRASATALALAGAALAYPASQALHLTNTGAEVADRSTEFLFLGIAFVLAIGVTEFWLARAPTWRRSVMTMAVIAVLFMGQTIVGNGPPWARMPGPYLVSADQRSIEPESIAAAEWAHSYLGPGHRIASDRINTLLMATYGGEWVVTASNDKIAVWPLFISPQFRPRMEEILRQDRIQYLVVDHRLSTGLPRVGTYFNKGEPNALHYTRPIDAAALAKFDSMKDVSRLFDSGDIVIYDVGAIASGSSPQSSCAFAPSTTLSPASAYPYVAELYTGTIHDLSTGITTNIFLRGIQQQQWNICGYFGEVFVNYLPSGMPGNGPFTGIITADNGIQFIVTSDTKQATFSFNGVILPDGTITGTYCKTIAGKCSNYGLWNVSPLTGG